MQNTKCKTFISYFTFRILYFAFRISRCILYFGNGCVIDHTSCWICPAEVFRQGMWSQLKEIEDPELRELASSLPDVVLQGKAPAFFTMEVMGREKEGCMRISSLSIAYKPVPELYNSDLIAPVEQAVYALAWVHSLAGMEDPTQHLQVKQVLAGANAY